MKHGLILMKEYSIFHFTLDSYYIMLSVKQGDIYYHIYIYKVLFFLPRKDTRKKLELLNLS